MQRQAERLALDVPQRHVQRAERVRLLAPRRIEPGDEHLLPDRLDLEGILADQRAGALLERVLRAALADAGDAEVGLDRAEHVALVEQQVRVRRLVDADARDLAAREAAGRGAAGWARCGGATRSRAAAAGVCRSSRMAATAGTAAIEARKFLRSIAGLLGLSTRAAAVRSPRSRPAADRRCRPPPSPGSASGCGRPQSRWSSPGRAAPRPAPAAPR